MSELNWALDGPTGSPSFGEGQTDWFTVQMAGRHVPESAQALEKLCRTYWYPLYAYVRRQGYSPPDAQDLTQDFFARLLATPWLEEVHPSKGRFRSFLLGALNHFLANERRRGQAQKRGGGCMTFSFDSVEAEERFHIEPAHDQTPDRIFERECAATVLERAVALLGQEYAATGKNELFEALKAMLAGGKCQHGYATVGRRLGMTEGAVKKAAQRLRERYHELLRIVVAQTVQAPDQVEEELRSLFAVLHG